MVKSLSQKIKSAFILICVALLLTANFSIEKAEAAISYYDFPPIVVANVHNANTIELGWQTIPSVSQYRVYRDGQPVALINGSKYTDTVPQQIARYEYKVAAVNGSGSDMGASVPIVVSNDVSGEKTSLVSLVLYPSFDCIVLSNVIDENLVNNSDYSYVYNKEFGEPGSGIYMLWFDKNQNQDDDGQDDDGQDDDGQDDDGQDDDGQDDDGQDDDGQDDDVQDDDGQDDDGQDDDGQDDDPIECGAGTILNDQNECVPIDDDDDVSTIIRYIYQNDDDDDITCGVGTVLLDGECVLDEDENEAQEEDEQEDEDLQDEQEDNEDQSLPEDDPEQQPENQNEEPVDDGNINNNATGLPKLANSFSRSSSGSGSSASSANEDENLSPEELFKKQELERLEQQLRSGKKPGGSNKNATTKSSEEKKEDKALLDVSAKPAGDGGGFLSWQTAMIMAGIFVLCGAGAYFFREYLQTFYLASQHFFAHIREHFQDDD